MRISDWSSDVCSSDLSPLAERRAAALSLDSTLLAELLGRVELRELLDAGVIEQAERELQRLVPDRKAKDLEGVADLLRMLGPLTTDEVTEQIGRASGRERVCQYVSIRVCAVSLKKKEETQIQTKKQ